MTTAVAAAITVAVATPAAAAPSAVLDGSDQVDRTAVTAATRVVQEVSGGTASALTQTSTIQGLRVAPASVDGLAVRTIVSPSKSGVALAAVLTSGQSRADFANPLPAGQRLKPTAGGGFDILSGTRRVGSVGAPWALDARGHALSTRYALRADGGLSQIVDIRDAVFPVVADPKYSVGFHVLPVWYLEYYWSEMWKAKLIMDKYGRPSAAIVSFLCAKIPSAPAKAVCAYVVNNRYATISAHVHYGIKHKRCMKVRNGFGVSDAALFKAWTKKCIK